MASVRPLEKQLSLVSEILTDTRKYNVAYAQDAKIMIEWHLQTLLAHFTSLSVKYEDYTYNNGHTVGMIKLTGTIPIVYINVKYNIPVTIWISEQYPKQPPITYVTPNASMIIRDNHPHVDRSGAVRTPYLVHWRRESDLVGMTIDMVNIFGQEPPLYAKPTPTQMPTGCYPSQLEMTSNPQIQGYSPGPSSGLTTTAYHSPNSYPQPEPFGLVQKPKPKPMDAVSQVNQMKSTYRETLLKALTDRVQQSLVTLNQSIQSDAQTEEDNAILKQRAVQIQNGIGMLQAERETYEHNVQTMAMMVAEMTDWKSKMDISEDITTSSLGPKDVIVPEDPFAAQLLQVQAEDLAAEDCLTALDSLFQKEVIDLENYMKQIKKVCRVQYYARALTMKIAEMHNTQQ